MIKYGLIGLFVCSLAINSVYADLQNGNFETGDLTNWSTQGSIEVLQSSNFSTSIPVPEGDYYVLISNIDNDDTTPDDSPFADADGDGQPDNDQTVLSQTFTCEEGLLCFKWSWLSNEENEADVYDDIFYVRLDDTIILSGSVDKGYEGVSPFPNVPTDDDSYSVTSIGLTNGSMFDDGRSEFAEFCTSITAGEHTIYFVVADQGNHGVDSGLIIDNITISEETAVELSSFKAKSVTDGTVNIAWETATEVDNAGFNIYRAKSIDGHYKKINDELINANGGGTAGAIYSYEDTPGRGAFYYKLEDIDTNGVSTMHGPVKVRNGESSAGKKK